MTDARVLRRSQRLARRTVVEAEGNYLITDTGQHVLDAVSGSMTTSFGYTNPDVVEAMEAMARRLPYVHDSRAGYAEVDELTGLLLDGCPLDDPRVYYTVSGSDAVEAAIRIAALSRPGRGTVLGVEGSYHGSTLGALRATGAPRITAELQQLIGAQHLLPAPLPTADRERCLEQVREVFRRHGEDIVAVVVEPVIANGSGTVVLPRWYTAALRLECDRYGAVVIADEITTSLWRCGTKFTSPTVGLQPDLLCVGKGLAVGYAAISAVLARGAVADAAAARGGLLGHNYNTHPIAVAAAAATLRKTGAATFETDIDRIGHDLEQALAAAVERSPWLTGYRRVGLLASVDLADDRGLTSEAVANALWEQGELLVLAGKGARGGGRGEHITLAPSFVTSSLEIDVALARITSLLATHERMLTDA